MNNKDKHFKKGIKMKDSLMESSIGLFSKQGFDGISVKDITDSIGVPKSLFYHYFSSKEEILETIIRKYELKITTEENEAVLQNLTEDAFGNIIARIYFKIQEEPDVLRLLMLEALKNNKIMQTFMKKVDILSVDFDSVLPPSHRDTVSEEELLVFRFFFRFAPIIFFSLTKEAVADYYGYSAATLEQQFMKLLKHNFIFTENKEVR